MTVPALSLPRLFEGFVLSRQAAGVRDTTLTMYRTAYTSLLSSLDDASVADVRNITPDELVAWAAAQRHYATATRDQRISKLKALFAWAHREGFLATDPALVLHRPRRDWQPDPLTPEEATRLLEVSRRGRNAARNHAIVSLMLDTGIRNSELCALRRQDIALRTGQIVVEEGKGGKSRTLVCGKRTRDALWRWLAVAPEGARALFVSEHERPLTRTVLRRIIAVLGREAGLRGRVFPHRLRHTFAVLYLRNRGDPYTLQYMLGHTDMSVTRMYVKLAAADVAETYRSPLDALG